MSAHARRGERGDPGEREDPDELLHPGEPVHPLERVLPGERVAADGPLEDLIAAFVDRRESGEPLTPEAFCAEHAAHATRLAPLLRELASTEAMFPSAHSDLPARMGSYRVVGEIGRGGMGRVLEVVHDDRPHETVALKVLHAPFADSARSLERFRREGRALERISHTGVVRVLEVGLVGDRPYIAMERVDGRSLARLIADRRDAPSGRSAPDGALGPPSDEHAMRRAAELVLEMARAIEAAHAVGVLHRDLNPRNVLLRPDGRPVVIDFGLMRSEVDPTLTSSGDVLGTPQYMAPEQARGEKVDARTDVFGLGTILHELVSLSPPRANAGALTLLKDAGSHPIAPLAHAAPGCDRALAIIAHRATAFAPRHRYASAARLADDLERWLAGGRIEARRAGIVERAYETWLRRRVAVSASAIALPTAIFAAIAWRASATSPSSPSEVHRAIATVAMPWLDGDLESARARWAELRARVPDHALGEFLDAACADDFGRNADRPASRALISGERARREGRAIEATKHFATAWDVAPGEPLIALLQGIAELEAGDATRARGKLEGAAFYFGGSHALHRKLAELYVELETWPDVSRALHAALALDENDADAWILLARARSELGDADGAIEAARKALKLPPVSSRVELERVTRFLDDRGMADPAAEIRSAIAR